MFCGAILLACLLVFLVGVQGGLGGGIFILLLLGVASLVIGIITSVSASKEYKTRYKHEIHTALLRLFSDDLSYLEIGGISEAEFKDSGLFNGSVDRFDSEDLIEGHVGKTKIRFSEVHAEEKHTTQTKNGTQTSYVTLFKGVFFVADFNKHFHGRTLVKTDIAERLLGSFGRVFQKAIFTPGQLIQMENPVFEKEFAVYATDPVEARYILTPVLMEKILELQNRNEKSVQLSFYNSSVIIALERRKNLFEPDFSTPATDLTQMTRIYEEIGFFINIVRDLDLNTRIWSKE